MYISRADDHLNLHLTYLVFSHFSFSECQSELLEKLFHINKNLVFIQEKSCVFCSSNNSFHMPNWKNVFTMNTVPKASHGGVML